MDLTPGVPGVSEVAPGATKPTIWGLVRYNCPKNEEDLKYSQKTRVVYVCFLNFDGSLKFVPFGGNISLKTQQFYLWKKILIFWHPWDPQGRGGSI
jgi:hypothetical protein